MAGCFTEAVLPTAQQLKLLQPLGRRKSQCRSRDAEAVAEALGASESTGECFFEAELYRLRGDLLLKREAQTAGSKVEGEAEVCFRQALEIARRQRAKAWELRAATSLSRLLASQHQRDEACTMLAEIYNWFTEGFDTADLKDAKALLDELTT
jgi:hypothetical protein